MANDSKDSEDSVSQWPMQRIAAAIFVSLWSMVMVVPCLLFFRYSFQHLIATIVQFRKLKRKQSTTDKERARQMLSANPKPPIPEIDAGDFFNLTRQLKGRSKVFTSTKFNDRILLAQIQRRPTHKFAHFSRVETSLGTRN
ncbi:Oidioi.mRNA.OKI2018_I69.chr2.g7387.t2.cds [Oikopleura dioica]|uniref:Oidioi.mRNA.OKI2018_I69.chr2.g7387.t2.cds n=1 Tax=Oikopleura dioica TaxID=34765 RepID=A0ABN7T9J3_OIKDI|nr:Oidioi.mRNA.OKI2018_I69.chr2.g7387.t2.cds [Oikopleura dioica]